MNDVCETVLCMQVKPVYVKEMRTTLLSIDLIDKTKKAFKCDDGVAIPIKMAPSIEQFIANTSKSLSSEHAHFRNIFVQCVCVSCRKLIISYLNSETMTKSKSHVGTCQCDADRCSGDFNRIPFQLVLITRKKSAKLMSPLQRLKEELLTLLANRGVSVSDNIMKEFPKKWEKHGDLILFPTQSIISHVWNRLTGEDWQQVAAVLGCLRLAHRTGAVQPNGFRSPKIEMLFGDSGCVEHVDNGVRYSYDVTKCMLSSGNISEKLRVANMKCDGETIVDLYAGIGYFTLPYLIHANAAFVYACEWNPDAVVALKRNLTLNNVQARCTIYEGDNRKTCLSDVADRINLGLIPSSVSGWPVACKALKRTGGILHIHGNVTSMPTATSCQCCVEPVYMRENVKIETSSDFKTDDLIAQPLSGVGSPESSECSNLKKKLSTGCYCVKGINGYNKASNALLRHKAWQYWSKHVAQKIKEFCLDIKGGDWSTEVLHIEKVKSYAPHIDHIVVDLECRPMEVSPQLSS